MRVTCRMLSLLKFIYVFVEICNTSYSIHLALILQAPLFKLLIFSNNFEHSPLHTNCSDLSGMTLNHFGWNFYITSNILPNSWYSHYHPSFPKPYTCLKCLLHTFPFAPSLTDILSLSFASKLSFLIDRKTSSILDSRLQSIRDHSDCAYSNRCPSVLINCLKCEHYTPGH